MKDRFFFAPDGLPQHRARGHRDAGAAGAHDQGISGYSASAELAFIYLNPRHPRFAASLDVELLPTIAHEFFHCARWRGPGYGATLGEALVSEGLALHFEILFRGQPPFYATALSEAQLLKLQDEARPLLDKTDYGHVAWFVGSPERGIPKYDGYSLAFFIVSKALLAFRVQASHVWNRPGGGLPESCLIDAPNSLSNAASTAPHHGRPGRIGPDVQCHVLPGAW